MKSFDHEFRMVTGKNPRWVFASVVGSHNYGTASEHSDVDMKMMYLPTFEEYYKNKFVRSSDGGAGAVIDFTCHPFHEYVKHSLKGNMNFWEVWFSPHLRFNRKMVEDHWFRSFQTRIMIAVRLNYLANFNATRGMAIEKFKRFERKIHLPGEEKALTSLNVDRHNKEIQHAVRLLSFLLYYENERSISLELSSKYNARYVSLRNNIKPISVDRGSKMFHDLMDSVNAIEPRIASVNETMSSERKQYFDSIDEMVFELCQRRLYNV